MWIDFPDFTNFTDGIAKNAIETCGVPIEDISNFSLPNFNDGATKLAGFRNVGKSFINIDGISCMPDADKLKKYVIFDQSKKTCIMIYVSDGSLMDLSGLVRSKVKMREEQVEAVRSALDGRSIKYAFKLLSDAQVGVTLKQVTNQARSVSTTIKKQRGRRPVTNPSDFVELTRIHRSARFYSEKSDFRFIFINENLMSLYVNALPSKKRLGKIRSKLDGIEQWSTDEVNEYIDSNREHSVKGSDKRLPHMELDTTFDLSSCYVTILSGTLPHFVTRSSGKMRHVALGFMIHTSKHAHHHEAFSNFIMESIQKLDPKFKKRVPSIIHDGEAAFSNYRKGIHFESAVLCRCDLHRRSNIERLTASKVSDSDMKKLFGKTDAARFLKRGIFGALTLDNFEYRLEKSTVDDQIKIWIASKKEELFDSHSLKTKLLAGFYTQNVTSNQIECINSKIKTTIIQRPENGRTCAARLIDYLADEVTSLYRSALEGGDSYIICTAFDPSHSSFSLKQNIDFLAKLGFTDCLAPILNIPPTLKSLIPTTNANDILNLEVIPHIESFLVQKNQQARSFVEVVVKNEIIECRHPACQKQFPEICSHIIAVLLNSEVHHRDNYLNVLVAKVAEVTIRQSERAQERRGQARRYKRKLTQFSRTNHDRGLAGVHPDTPHTTIQSVGTLTETETPNDRTVSPIFPWNSGLNDDDFDATVARSDSPAFDSPLPPKPIGNDSDDSVLYNSLMHRKQARNIMLFDSDDDIDMANDSQQKEEDNLQFRNNTLSPLSNNEMNFSENSYSCVEQVLKTKRSLSDNSSDEEISRKQMKREMLEDERSKTPEKTSVEQLSLNSTSSDRPKRQTRPPLRFTGLLFAK